MEARRPAETPRSRHRAPERRRHPAVRLVLLLAGAAVLVGAIVGVGAYVVNGVGNRHVLRVQSSLPAPVTARPSVTTASSTPTAAAPPLVPAELRGYCHSGFPLAGVYSPGRLQIKSTCAAITGTVRSTNIEHDGDLHVSLLGVDARWLNAGNLARSDHAMVAEAVPDLPITTPPVGAKVTLIGPWVLDTETGWMEIHPVWKVLYPS